MSHDARPLPPSPHKLRRARERGEVAVTALLGSAATTTVMAAYLAMSAEEIARQLGALVAELFDADAFARPDPRLALQRAAEVLVEVLAWPLVLVLAAGVLASFVQVGPLFSTKAFELDLSRLSPSNAGGRILDPRRALERLLGAVGVFALLAIAALVLRDAVGGLAGRVAVEPADAAALAGATLGAFALRASILLAVMAAAAVVYRRVRYLREQSMSYREAEREQRELEGDPALRRRQRALRRAAANAPTLEEALRVADVVVHGASGAAILSWRDRERPPRLVLFARGPLRDRAVADAPSGACVADEALSEALASAPLDRPVPRRLYARLAPLFAGRR